MDRPVRKSPRLKDYDYSLCGAYFLTICAYKFQHLFGQIDFALQENSIGLSEIGAIVQKNLGALPERFPEFELLNYVIMPNHLHILILKAISADGLQSTPRKPTSGTVALLRHTLHHLIQLISAITVEFLMPTP